jgi:hypothetical protein
MFEFGKGFRSSGTSIYGFELGSFSLFRKYLRGDKRFIESGRASDSFQGGMFVENRGYGRIKEQ